MVLVSTGNQTPPSPFHRMHSKLLLFIISSVYLSLSTALNCSNERFDCGNIAYIAYPFWGGLRTSECGRQGFEIVCNPNNIPIIKISSISYILQKLDFTTNTLTVARLDLHDTYCPKTLRNTTIDWDLFTYPPNSTDRNLTLYYDCPANQPPLFNSFTCTNHTSNLFSVADVSSSSCQANIYVPVNKEDAKSLQNSNPSSINILRSALTTGFSIQWFNDTRQGTETYCNRNVPGSCGISYKTLNPDRPVCDNKVYQYCLKSSGNQGNAPSPAPVHTEDVSPTLPSPAPVPTEDVSPTLPSPAPVHTEDVSPTLPTPAYAPRTPHPYRPSRVPLGSDSNTQVNNGNNRVRKMVQVVPPMVAGVVIASIAIYCFLRRRGCPNPESNHDVETFLLQHGSLAPKRYRYSEIKKITKSFSDKLGQGGYGSVYKGFLPDGRPVAVKILIHIDSNGEEFINEVASISRTSHVNIVTLLGFCYEGNQRALVYEFMPNSSLDKFLPHNQSHCPLDLEQLYKIAVGIAKGLKYLHTGCNAKIVHFDIKPQNILLDEDLCPKISDFGLAKLYKKKQSILSVLGTRGTAGYIAPEVFSRNFGEVSHKSDVYSYGMMLLEMARGRKLYEDEAIQSSENYLSGKIYEEMISDVRNIVDLEMGGEEEARKKMLVVGFWCIQTTPSNRPSISKVVEMFEGSLEAIQIPPKPFLSFPGTTTQNSAQY